MAYPLKLKQRKTMKKIILAAVLFLPFLVSCSQNRKAPDVSPQTTVGKTEKNETAKVQYLTTSDFRKKIMDYEAHPDEWVFAGSRPAVIDFYTTWCGPCKMMAPVVESLAGKYAGKIDFYKVDIDQESELASVFGIILGAVQYCISMGTGFDGFLVHLTNHTVGEGDDAKAYGLIHCLSDPWNVGILVFLVVLGSIVSLMNKAGGSAAFGRWASKHVHSKIGVQIATILLGILIFIDDYFNCLTVGSVMRPIAVRNGVTKEKLAYLIDSTAAPVCIISPISSWAAAVSGFVSGGENGLALFCKAIPFNFYAFFTILFMFGIVILGFDFKAMSKYDARLKEWYERTNGGKLDEVSDTKLQIVEHGVGAKQEEDSKNKGTVSDLVIPIIMLIIFCMAGMVYSGGFFDADNANYLNFVDSFAASNASVGLVIGSLAALILTIMMFTIRKTLPFDEAMSSLIKGFEAMVPAILILTLAWTLKSMTDSLGAAEYVSSVVASSASELQMLLPGIIFLVAGFLAFATGTSWGTFGILIPICIAVFPGADPLRIISISACMAGAVCGDHISPISDTTIMASAGAECKHVHHVSSQLPYALTVACVSFFTFIVAGFTHTLGMVTSAIISWIFGVAMLGFALFYLNKRQKVK
jgi:tetracycline resistance efflux pump